MINYGGETAPTWLTCCHEESSAAMAHGYAKIEGKPMMIMAHGTVGLQHASMAIYNCYADRVPQLPPRRRNQGMRRTGSGCI
jgi:acetolactate synthase I/II/III large subunit